MMVPLFTGGFGPAQARLVRNVSMAATQITIAGPSSLRRLDAIIDRHLLGLRQKNPRPTAAVTAVTDAAGATLLTRKPPNCVAGPMSRREEP